MPRCPYCREKMRINAKICPNCTRDILKETIRGWKRGRAVRMGFLVIIGCIIVYASQSQDVGRSNLPQDVIEQRAPIRDGIQVHTGPGANYSLDEGGSLMKFETLYVLADRGEWIRIRVTRDDVGWSGWVKKSDTKQIEP